MKDNISSNLGEIPNPFKIHDHIFDSVNDSTLAIKAILKSLMGNNSDGDDDYLIKGAKVKFIKKPTLDVEINHKERIVIFYFKKIETGDENEIKDIEMQLKREIMLDYANGIDDFRSRLALTIYRSLTSKAQKILIENEKKLMKK